MLQRFEPVPMHALLLERTNHPLDQAILLRAVKLRLVKTRPLSLRSRNGTGTRPSVPKRASRACSSALDAVQAFPLRDRCQPSSSRVWQSITKAKVAQPSLPAQIRHMSVDQRSFGAVATDGNAWMRGRKPMGRFLHCQLRISRHREQHFTKA